MNEPIAYLNGQWIPASAAAVPIDDAGFVLGAAVAEQLRTFKGRLFRLDDHLARLWRSLEIVGIDLGIGREELAALAERLVERNFRLLDPDDDLRLSIVATPGTHPAYVRDMPARPWLCLHTHPLAFHLWADKYRLGQSLATTDVRQVPTECWPAELKCRSRMHYYLADAKAAAIDPEARALMLDADGFVTEASTANLLIYRRDEGLLSPPWTKTLRGISMSTVTDLARRLGIGVGQRELTIDDVAAADEAMLTSTSTCILPVVRLNGRVIGEGRPGKIFQLLLDGWSAMVGVDIAAQARRRATGGP
jgi:branched-subunit amino acid aminotransferase/4-amino-4-deoxychorismate lyase